VLYFLNAIMEQKRRLEKKIEQEQLIFGALPQLSVRILELARDHGRLTVAEASKATGRRRNTIKDHLKNLTKNSHLARGVAPGTRSLR